MNAATPGQTIGPFFGYALPFPGGSELVPPGRAGAVRLHGRVLDGAGDPVPDALIELRQTDAEGNVPRRPGSLHRDGWTFTGWGRCATDADGRYAFTTLRPAATTPDGAPFFALTVFARGLLDRLLTRAYLPEHSQAMARDALLGAVEDARRGSLVAAPDPTGYRFDVVLQGPDETVFLAHRPAPDPGHP